MKNNLDIIKYKSIEFLSSHIVGSSKISSTLNGSFSLNSDSNEIDLYGMIDSVYILYILGVLNDFTTKDSRMEWADKILSCQDRRGWFTIRHYKNHSKEHSSAYAIAALKLLAEDDYYDLKIKPVVSLKNLLTDKIEFNNWISKINLNYSKIISNIIKFKIRNTSSHLGWHYVWKGSHFGAGIPAMLSMTSHLYSKSSIDFNEDYWFKLYFNWLNEKVNPKTGYWQIGFWNLLYSNPNTIDLGGAAHFYWLYDRYSKDFPYPEELINSTILTQKKTGLYRKKPFCIDLDGNFCIIRSFKQLSHNKQKMYSKSVFSSIEKNFNAVVSYLVENDFKETFTDLHVLPGALAAIAECSILDNNNFKSDYKSVFEKVCWL